MKHLTFLFLMMSLILASCGPSDAEIQATVQASIAQTQTAIPTPIPNPCSDRGWADINTYLHLFYQQLRNAEVGNSIYTFFQQLEGFRDKIGAVSIDACTEHARQLIVSGVDNMIIAIGLIWDASGTSHSDEANDNADQLILEGKSMIADARAELKGLGIHLDYP
jgi:hypothetical protein